MKHTLNHNLASVRRARELVAEELRSNGVAAGVAEDAVLLVSELVTNSIRHGEGEIVMECLVSDLLIRIEVTDGHAEKPVLREPDPNEPNGRGMLIVDMVASRWGSDAAATGKTVWFELSRS